MGQAKTNAGQGFGMGGGFEKGGNRPQGHFPRRALAKVLSWALLPQSQMPFSMRPVSVSARCRWSRMA